MTFDDFDLEMNDVVSDNTTFGDLTPPTVDFPSMDNSLFGHIESSDGSYESYTIPFNGSLENHEWEHHSAITHFRISSSSSETLEFMPDNNQFSSIRHIGHSQHQSDTTDPSDYSIEISFRGGEHTVGERNAAISQAKHDIAEAESDIRHQTNMINSKTRMGEPHSAHDSALHSAQNRLAEAKRALNNAYNMKTKS